VVARIVAVESSPPAAAVKFVVATPEASETADAGAKAPAVALITEKATVWLGHTTPLESTKVTLTAVVPLFSMVEAESVTWTVSGVPPSIAGVGALVSTSLQPAKTVRRVIMTVEVIRRAYVFSIKIPPKDPILN
jgi:hypothetical protein